eukprot:gene12517-biopygen2563
MMKLKVCMPLAATLMLLFISMSRADMKASEKAKIRTGFNEAQKIFTIMSELKGKDKVGIYKSLGKMAGFLGATGGLISIALLFLPQEESAELKALKKGFAEVNMKLDVITTVAHSFTDKHGKYSNGRHKVYLAIEDIKEKVNFYLARDDAYKMLPVFIKEFEKRDVMKYINSIGLLREYDSYAITADNELTYIDEVHLFTSRERSQSYVDSRRGEIRYHTTEDKVRVVITLKSEEQVSGVKCSLECSSHGRCKEMPFSSARYCQCKPFYQGQKCEDKVKANLAKTMDAMLAKTLKLPMLSDIAYDIKDMREYVGVGIGALQAAVSELEEKFQRAYDKISHQLSSQFEWANLLTLYSSSLQNIKQYALRFETLPKRYADIMEEEGRKLATAVLAPNGIERWLTDVNFLLIGRSGVPLLKHKPMLILFMNKYKNQACLDSYKNAVSSAWKQLVLLQTIGFMVWAQALEFNDRGPHRIVNLYKQRTDLQMAKFKSTTCHVDATAEARGAFSVLTPPENASVIMVLKETNAIIVTANGRVGQVGLDVLRHVIMGNHHEPKVIDEHDKAKESHVLEKVNRLKPALIAAVVTNFIAQIGKSAFRDYDNDCGDNQDEQSCQEQCTTKYTAWDEHGGGNSIFLDRQKLDCGGQGQVLKMFHLEARPDQIRYKYKCCKLNKPTMCTPTSHSTGYTYDGKGDTFFLDRQTLDCSKNGYLNDMTSSAVSCRSEDIVRGLIARQQTPEQPMVATARTSS